MHESASPLQIANAQYLIYPPFIAMIKFLIVAGNMAKLIIIGGGFAGVNAAQALRKAPIDILLLDRTNHHVFQPLLYQVATAALSIGNITSPLREIFENQVNTTVLMENVTHIHRDRKLVETSEGKVFSYDYLIVAPGARHSYFGHEEWGQYALGLKTVADASKIRERILMAFEIAERTEDPELARKYLNFAIIGGGPTGVEMAGSIAEFAHRTLLKNFRHIDPEQSKIYLIEGEGQLLPSYPKHLADIALRNLEQLGVTVILNKHVTNVNEDGIHIEEEFLNIPTIIWAAGNQASPLLKTLDTPLDKQGRVVVNPDLSIPNDPNVFVVGDAAACKDEHGRMLPAIAPVAIQQARYVAKIIKKQIKPGKRQAFRYFDKGMIATIGRGRAVALLRKLQFSGLIAWLIWGFVHILYLISFKNRILVMTQWAFLYFTENRPDRIINHPIE
ncbi:MAG: NAD(P)/FAD-dependent oxidoreductase [Parachlamydiaceae bacterium]